MEAIVNVAIGILISIPKLKYNSLQYSKDAFFDQTFQKRLWVVSTSFDKVMIHKILVETLKFFKEAPNNWISGLLKEKTNGQIIEKVVQDLNITLDTSYY